MLYKCDGAFVPLLENHFNATLEGEMETHMDEVKKEAVSKD